MPPNPHQYDASVMAFKLSEFTCFPLALLARGVAFTFGNALFIGAHAYALHTGSYMADAFLARD
jgi:hypothetical protein